jgi:hypothetical protein
MMAMVSDPTGVKLKREEVLALPALGQTAYNADTLMGSLSELGWRVEMIPDEEDFVWLEKNGTWVLVYYKEGKKQTELYFAEADRKPEPPVSKTTPPVTAQPSSEPVNNTAPVSDPTPPSNTQTQPQTPTTPAPQQPAAPVSNGYKFNTTNFDDGWTAVEESDWVRVTKGNITVLLHYNHYKVDYSSLDWETMSRNAWNVIVAPRYTSLKNFFMTPHMITWQTPYYMSGTMTDASGEHFVAFFRRERNEWIEVIAPDKQTVENEFKFREDQLNTYSSEAFDKLMTMYGKNYFAVAASDLPGHWTTNSFGMTQYYNTYTGLSAGATSHSSTQEFIIAPDLTYSWSIGMASGWVGAQRFDNAKSNGKVTMIDNWNAHFSNLEGKPKDYAVYFTAHKGARKLWIYGSGYMKKQ